MIEVIAPTDWHGYEDVYPIIFLSGSIEMGRARKWRKKIARMFRDKNVVLLNPRRDDWDSSWVQSIDNPQFVEQVEWELDGLERADFVIVYFDPKTKSPITLLELGMFSTARSTAVICPDGFWRKGNVEIFCKKYGIDFYHSLEEFEEKLKKTLEAIKQ